MTQKPHIYGGGELAGPFHEVVTPIFRKTGPITLGADAFTRAEDVEQAVYQELPRLVEQLEAAQQECEDWRRRFTQMTDSAFALANSSAIAKSASNPASELRPIYDGPTEDGLGIKVRFEEAPNQESRSSDA